MRRVRRRVGSQRPGWKAFGSSLELTEMWWLGPGSGAGDGGYLAREVDGLGDFSELCEPFAAKSARVPAREK